MRYSFLTAILLSITLIGFSQDNDKKNKRVKQVVNCEGDTTKYLSIGKDEKGLGLGNPTEYKGVRFSFVDKNCITNGVSINLFSAVSIRQTNGLDFGLSQSAGIVNGLSLGVLGNNIDYELNGFGFGTVLSEALNINGVSLTGGFQRVDKFRGACIAGLYYRSFETYGSVLTGGIIRNDSIFKGGAVTGLYTKMGILKGFSIALSNWAEEVKGFQLGLINKTNYMKGVQFGAINIITENPNWARVFPLINFGFKAPEVNVDLGLGRDVVSIDPCRNGTMSYEMASETNTISEDSEQFSEYFTISFETPYDYKNLEIYLDDILVYPVENQIMDTLSYPFEKTIKIKSSAGMNFLKVVDKVNAKCLVSSWKPKYSILRISNPYPGTEYTLFTFTNKFIERPEDK